jgi:hypothetical protein
MAIGLKANVRSKVDTWFTPEHLFTKRIWSVLLVFSRGGHAKVTKVTRERSFDERMFIFLRLAKASDRQSGESR